MQSLSKRSGQDIEDIRHLWCAPASKSPLATQNTESQTVQAEDGSAFPVINGQPVLVEFSNSILVKDDVLASAATSLIGPRPNGRPLWKRILLGDNKVTPKSAHQLVDLLNAEVRDPVVLIIGGGTLSDGSQVLYEQPSFRIISFDVYANGNTDFVADAHDIPIVDESVDAVWIEAVLEHVLSPHEVAEEIWRVLKPTGLVYAGKPFLQPVHERAYDFTRFTENGQRWLFRRFSLIDSGVVAGPGTALFQILRYAIGAVLGHRRWGARLAAPFFWLRFMDRFSHRDHASDAASGVYFLGRKSDTPLKPSEMPAQFKGVS